MKKIAIVFYFMAMTISYICGQEQFVIQKCDDQLPIVVKERSGQPVCLRGEYDIFGVIGSRDTFSINYTIELLVVESPSGQTVLQVDCISYKSDYSANLDTIVNPILCINTFMAIGEFCYCEEAAVLSTDKLYFEVQLRIVPFVCHDNVSQIKRRKSIDRVDRRFRNPHPKKTPPMPHNSELSIWLSVDPLSDKYPGVSPYVYCENNPVRLVDVDGREVEYSSFADRLIVGILKIFDSGFRNQYKELKKSKETYVFNKNNEGTNSFTTDGNKLFINYSMADNGYSKNAGQTIFSNLRHETTHGIQFEYGELGFYFRRMGYGIVDAEGIYYEIREWQPIAYDLTDEYEAHNNQNLGFRWNGGKNDSRNQWKISDRETRMQSLRNVDSYSILPEVPFACPNDKRIKSNDTYALPHKERPHNLSYGKSFGTPPILPIRGMEYVHPIFPQSISILKEDTVFCYNLYVTNNAVDSIRLAYFSVKIKGEKYIRRFDDGSYWFIKYKKIYKISSLERVIRSKSIGTVVKPRSIFRYDKDGRLTEYFFIFCGISFSRSY